MENHYEYLEKMCERFPTLWVLKCSVFEDKVIVKMTDGAGLSIIEKEMIVDTPFENKEEIEEIKSRCAWDIICSLCLASFSNIKKAMNKAVVKRQEHLN